jgi:hypothetical protein
MRKLPDCDYDRRTLQTFHSSHGGDRKIFEVMITTSPLGTPGLLYPFLTKFLYQVNHDMNHKLWLS